MLLAKMWNMMIPEFSKEITSHPGPCSEIGRPLVWPIRIQCLHQVWTRLGAELWKGQAPERTSKKSH